MSAFHFSGRSREDRMQLAQDKVPSLQQNLASVRAARELREREKRLQQCASRIQRAYRRHRVSAAIAVVAKSRLRNKFDQLGLAESILIMTQLQETDCKEFGAKIVAKVMRQSPDDIRSSFQAVSLQGMTLVLGFLFQSLLVAERNLALRNKLFLATEAIVTCSPIQLQNCICRFFLTTRNALAAQLLAGARREFDTSVLGLQPTVALALLNADAREEALKPALDILDAITQQELASTIASTYANDVVSICGFCDGHIEGLNPFACVNKLSRIIHHCPSQALSPLLQTLGKVCSRIPERDFLSSTAEYLLKGSATPLRSLFEETGLSAFCKMLNDSSVTVASVSDACYVYSLPLVQRLSTTSDERHISSALVSRLAMTPRLINLLWDRLSRSDLTVVAGGSAKCLNAPVTLVFLVTLTYIIEHNDLSLLIKRGEPFASREVQQIVAKFVDLVHRLHVSGIAENDNETTDVAFHSCRMLTKLHTVDERMSIVPSQSWSNRFGSQVPITLADWDEIVTTDDGEGHDLPITLPLSRAPVTQKVVQLLRNAPFLAPFNYRLEVLASLMIPERERFMFSAAREDVVVQRGRIFEDAFQKFGHLPREALLRHFRVRFRSVDGEIEAGFGDGVYREFLLSLCKEGFSPQYGLFALTQKGHVYPNPRSFEATGDAQHLARITFLGAMLGKALRDGILLDVPFASFFRNALLGRLNTINDLAEYDSDLHKSITLIDEQRHSVDDLMLSFSVTVECLGVVREVELVPGGSKINVTPANLPLYILLLVDFKLNREMSQQIDAFRTGLCSVVRESWIRMFDSNELQLLFEGNESSIGLDVDDWMAHTNYHSEKERHCAAVAFFWTVVREMTPQQQRQTLKFVTSFSRAPLLGFRHMSPSFNIVVLSGERDRLPSAATCYCTLKLPEYDTLQAAREKILQAVEGTNSFDFSLIYCC